MPPPPRNMKRAAVQGAKDSRPEYVPDAKTFVEAWEEAPGVADAYETADSIIPAIPSPPRYEDGSLYVPQMPDDITQIGLAELAQTFGHMVAYVAYLGEVAAREHGLAAESEAFAEGRKAEIALGFSGSAMDRKLRAQAHPETAELDRKVLVMQARARVFKARADGYEKMANALSRELTRRLTPEP